MGLQKLQKLRCALSTRATFLATVVPMVASVTIATFGFTAHAHAELSEPEMVKLLEEIDGRSRNSGDYKALAFLEQKEKDKNDILYDTVVYRRDADQSTLR